MNFKSPFEEYAHKRAENMVASPEQLIWLSHQHSMIYDEYSILIDESRLNKMISINNCIIPDVDSTLFGRFIIHNNNITLVEISRNSGNFWFNPSIYLKSKWPLINEMNQLRDLRTCVIRDIPKFIKIVNSHILKFNIYNNYNRFQLFFKKLCCLHSSYIIEPITIDLPIIIIPPESMNKYSKFEPDIYNTSRMTYSQLRRVCNLYNVPDNIYSNREYMEEFINNYVNKGGNYIIN